MKLQLIDFVTAKMMRLKTIVVVVVIAGDVIYLNRYLYSVVAEITFVLKK